MVGPSLPSPCEISRTRRSASAFASVIAEAGVPNVANDSTVEQAIAAVDVAHRFFPTWRDSDPIPRANEVLVRAAATSCDAPPRRALGRHHQARTAKTGARPTPMSARPSTSANTTPAWRPAYSNQSASARSSASSIELFYQPRGVCGSDQPVELPAGHLPPA